MLHLSRGNAYTDSVRSAFSETRAILLNIELVPFLEEENEEEYTYCNYCTD